LLKTFKKKRENNFIAVDNLSLGVESQSCFGLLGLNGAGKTTCFKLIIGELETSQGDVLINGYSINSRKELARKNLGYCPQFDRLPEYMTVKETLRLCAKLRGIKCDCVESTCKTMLNVFQLNEFKNSLVQNLSGGNKRKVSCAIAFIGKPNVIILDEVIYFEFYLIRESSFDIKIDF
jgi:ATP-binding cassette subfamily A (ABC1) protein 3